MIEPSCQIYTFPTQIFRELDEHMCEQMNVQETSEELRTTLNMSDQIEQSLRCATKCFGAQWLPLVSRKSHFPNAEVQNFIQDSWRAARGEMLKVINRPSYRSILALYLFAQTPVPIGISEDEELDGMSGPVCIQTALLQLQQLRERLRSLQLNGLNSESSAGSTNISTDYVDFESRAYWAAMMWDTSSSLAMSSRTSLTSGLKGACSEPTWRVVKAFLVASFHPRTEHWHTEGVEVTNVVACEIISAAVICKTYIWKNITSLKEALREGVDEAGVQFAWTALLDAIAIFKTSISPLLSSCERQLHFLDQRIRLNWFEVNLQYHLGILVLAAALESADRRDLLSEFSAARQDAELESFNVLKFGLETTYTVYGPRDNTNTGPEVDELSQQTFTASIIAIDPYPQYVVEAVLLMNKVFGRKYRQEEINHDTYTYLSSILDKALGQVPQGSKLVQAARQNLQRSRNNIESIYVTNTALGAI
ncbi:hypothetical protein EJ02DRAFT_134313 [Clathrospora elynae]|uniref:Uncharacterized protein n=1 Tax=Clathrospora elynae TaxID=706981 RepID=A0A6A5SUQ1_9PLEO|nr:hypothetical protein EJ02DRAFT_134313 [Clathrospora elynae]